MINPINQKEPKVLSEEGLTFEDVLVVPKHSTVLPKEVSTVTWLTKKIKINIPLISASMDTVTEARMAIAMAKNGGIGIIHKNMSIAEQAKAVKKVKMNQVSGLILNPLRCKESDTIVDVKNQMELRDIHHFAVENENGIFVGLISHKDIGFSIDDAPLTLVKDVMRENSETLNSKKNYEEAKELMKEKKIKWLPVINDERKITGLYTWNDVQEPKKYPKAVRDEKGRLLCGAAVGVFGDTNERVDSLVKSGVDVIVVDTAHGDSDGVIDQVKTIKAKYPDLQIIAGNVATAEGARNLAIAGADAVKVGIGPGSICTTRIVAGIGVPQLTAIMEAVKGLDGMGIPVIADGGIKYSGDIVKAIVAGADTVMAGSLFAGTDESPGNPEIVNGRKVKSYRGMGSEDAMRSGSAGRYLQDPEAEIKKLVPEGIVGNVPYKGSVNDIIYQMIGGLRAGMGYTDSKDIQSLQTEHFRRITSAGLRESHPHDVTITKDEVNYSKNQH